MILDIVESVDGVPIRLTDERFEHILNEHPYMSSYYNEMLAAVENPEFISKGNKGTKIAIINLGRRKWLHVFYREINAGDGFIISAYIDETYKKSLILKKY